MPFHIHANVERPIEHSAPAGNASGSQPARHELKPSSVISTGGFAGTPASDKPHGLLARLPTPSVEAKAVTWAGNTYFVKNPSNTSTPQTLYTRDSAGVLKQTSKQGIYDGKDGVKLDTGLPGGADKETLLDGKTKSKSTTPWTMKRLVNKFTRSSSASTSTSTSTSTSSSAAGYGPIAKEGTQDYAAQRDAALRDAMKETGMS